MREKDLRSKMGMRVAKEVVRCGVVLLVIFLIASEAYADYTCTDCHGPAQHSPQCNPACTTCHGYPPVDVSGLVHSFASEGKPTPTGAVSPGAHARHAATSGYNFACDVCHTGGMKQGAGIVGNNKIQIGFNVPLYGGTYFSGGSYDGRTLSAPYTYEGTNGSTVTANGSKTCSTIYCHSDGTYVSTAVLPVKTSPAWDTTSVPLGCNACHGVSSDSSGRPAYANPADGGPKANSHLASGHLHACNFCHYGTTNDGSSIATLSSHVNGAYDLQPDPTQVAYGLNVSFSYSRPASDAPGGAGGSCSAVSCHRGLELTWGQAITGGCTTCHTDIVQSGPNQNHHAAPCATCHGTPSWPLHQGTTPPSCASCHAAEASTIEYAQMSTLTCDQCHNPLGGVLPVMTPVSVCSNCHPNGVYDSYATNMHLQNPTANFGVSISGLTVNVDGSASACPSGATCSYDYNWGDGSAHGTSVKGSHIYTAGTYTITLTVSSSSSVSTAAASQSVTVAQPDRAPVAAFAPGSPVITSGWTVSVTDASTDPDNNLSFISVVWGDGATTRTTPGGTVTHTYTVASSYTIKLTATDTDGLSNTISAGTPITIGLGTVSGTVTSNGLPVGNAKVQITVGGASPYAYTNTSGVYTINNVRLGSGTMTVKQGTITLYTKSVTIVSGANIVNFP